VPEVQDENYRKLTYRARHFQKKCSRYNVLFSSATDFCFIFYFIFPVEYNGDCTTHRGNFSAMEKFFELRLARFIEILTEFPAVAYFAQLVLCLFPNAQQLQIYSLLQTIFLL